MRRLLLVLLIALPAAAAPRGGAVMTGDTARLELVAKRGVEAVLSYVLETTAKAGAVYLNQDDQVLEIKDLRIGNPKGFGDQDALKFGSVRVEADPKSLFSSKPVIRLMKVEGTEVNAETTPWQGSNLKKLMDSAGRFKGNKLMEKLPKKKWVVEKGLLSDATFNMTTELLERHTHQKKIENIEMSIGGEGLPADQAIGRFLERLMQEFNIGGQGGAADSVRRLLGK